MKKIMKIVFAILVFIPILVCAETYTFNKGLQEANSHINSTKYSTRNKYLLLNNNLSFVMNDNGSMSYDSRFINGGFLNYREYCLTVGNNSCNGKSYIIIPGSYWTGSGSPTDRYYVDIIKGISTKSDNNPSNVRVTEFIKSDTAVTGTGTFSNPWIFTGNYFVSISTNSKKYATFDENNKNKIDKYSGTSCISGRPYCANFDITLHHGYENYTNDGCNLKLVSKGSIKSNGSRTHKYEISNISSDIECVAVFVKKVFNISFNCSTGSGSVPSKTVTYDANLTLPENNVNCSKTGYLQDGWSNGNSIKWTGGSTVRFTYDDDQIGISNKSLTLRASWVANTYYVKYNGNTNTGGSTATSTHTYDTAKALTANGFTKTGYLFAGWANSAAGNVVYANNAEVLNLTATPNATVNLYAKWTPITYYVQYNGNTNTGGSTATSTHTYDTAKALTTNGFTKTGYTFNGWATSAGGNVAYGNDAAVKNLTTTPNATVNLYAKWTANTFTIAYNGNGANGGSRASHTCTYDQNCTLQANGFTRTGYTFAGWKKGNSGNTLAVGTSIKNVATGGTVTYYAQWTANTFTIAYNGNGANGGSRASHTCTYDQNCTLQANGFSRSGYSFAGWKKSNSGGTLGVGTSVRNVATSGTVTYYAQWNYCSAGTYESGGTCHTCPSGSYCTGGTAIAGCGGGTYSGNGASGCTPCGNGAYVTAWGSGCNIASCASGYRNSGNTCVLNTFTVYIDPNYADTYKTFNKVSSITVTYGQPMPSITQSERQADWSYKATGCACYIGVCNHSDVWGWHELKGYYDSRSGGTKYINADGSSARNWDKTSNATLYAQWKRHNCWTYCEGYFIGM